MSAGRFVAAALCLAAIIAVALAAWAARVPDLELRTQPWRTHTGRTTVPLGQGFVCDSDGLRCIDVAVAPVGGTSDGTCTLTLREGTQRNEPMRSVEASHRRNSVRGFAPGLRFLRFEFDPVPDSNGKTYFFDLEPILPDQRDPWTSFVVYRGQAQDVRTWGDHVASRAELEGSFVCEHPDLRALAIGMVEFDAAQGPVALELWRAGEDGPPFVRAEIAPSVSFSNGWAFFPMPVVHESRWKTYRYRLILPEGAQANAGPNGLSMVSYHGSGEVSPRLLGMTFDGESVADRDLVFRAWADSGLARTWRLLRERGGLVVALAALTWIGASIAVLALVRGRAGNALR